MMFSLASRLSSIIVLVCAAGANATVLVQDDFSTDGALTGSTPDVGGVWTKHSGTEGQITVASGAISLTDSDSEDTNSAFAAVGSAYFAFDITVTDPTAYTGDDFEYFAHFNTYANSAGYTCRTDVASFTASGYKFGVSTSSYSTAEVMWATELAYGTAVRLVVGYDATTGVCTLWVDPTSTTSTSIVSTTASTGVSLDAFGFRQGGATPDFAYSIANLVVSTSFADITGAGNSDPGSASPASPPSPPSPPPSPLPPSPPPRPPAVPLFFTEYAEGSSNNKFLEIYNPTSATVSLDGYAFPSTSNAPATAGVHEYWNTFTAGATIAAGGVYVICHPSSDASILALCDQTHSYLSNGDDGYCLAAGTETAHVLLDCVGDFNADPGSGWDVCGVATATKDKTLVRKFSVTTGNAGDWSTSAGTSATDCEWIVEPQDTWTYLGSHTARSPSPPAPPTPPTPPRPLFPPFPPVEEGEAVVQVEATVITLALQVAGDVSDFAEGSPTRDAFATSLRDELDCFEPECLLDLQVTSASVNVEAIITVVEAAGNAATTVSSAASTLATLPPAALTSSLGVTVEAAPTITVATGVVVPLLVAPPPPSPPAPAAADDEPALSVQMIIVIGIAVAVVLIVALLFCFMCRSRQQTNFQQPPGFQLNKFDAGAVSKTTTAHPDENGFVAV